jgi:hypothetical protein
MHDIFSHPLAAVLLLRIFLISFQDAGSAEVFRKVDHDYVAAAAAAAKAAGVPYFGLVSAQGANAGVPASDWRLLHPLLYTRTKGLVSHSAKKSLH